MSRRAEPVSKSHGIKIPPALKHGGYAASGLLPGEDAAAFEKLHRDLIAEIAPIGVLEEDIVSTMARIIWRKQNLATFRLAKLARDQYHKPASAEDCAANAF